MNGALERRSYNQNPARVKFKMSPAYTVMLVTILLSWSPYQPTVFSTRISSVSSTAPSVKPTHLPLLRPSKPITSSNPEILPTSSHYTTIQKTNQSFDQTIAPSTSPASIPIVIHNDAISNLTTILSRYPSSEPTIGDPTSTLSNHSLITPSDYPTSAKKIDPINPDTSGPSISFSNDPTSEPTIDPMDHVESDPTVTPSNNPDSYSLTTAPSSKERPPFRFYWLEAEMTLVNCDKLNEASITEWEDTTSNFLLRRIIRNHARNSYLLDLSVKIPIIQQTKIDSRALQTSRKSALQDVSITTSIKFSVHLAFRSIIEDHDAKQYVEDSFNTTRDQLNYIWSLEDTKDPEFLDLVSVTVEAYLSKQPCPPMEEIESHNSNGLTALVVISSFSVFGLIACFLYRWDGRITCVERGVEVSGGTNSLHENEIDNVVRYEGGIIGTRSEVEYTNRGCKAECGVPEDTSDNETSILGYPPTESNITENTRHPNAALKFNSSSSKSKSDSSLPQSSLSKSESITSSSKSKSDSSLPQSSSSKSESITSSSSQQDTITPAASNLTEGDLAIDLEAYKLIPGETLGNNEVTGGLPPVRNVHEFRMDDDCTQMSDKDTSNKSKQSEVCTSIRGYEKGGPSILKNPRDILHPDQVSGIALPRPQEKICVDYTSANFITMHQKRTDISSYFETKLAQLQAPLARTTADKGELLSSVILDSVDRKSYSACVEGFNEYRAIESRELLINPFTNASSSQVSLFSDDSSNEIFSKGKAEIIELTAPPGWLGIVIDTAKGGIPKVLSIESDSELTEKIQPGDKLISVNDIDTTEFSAREVSELITNFKDKDRTFVFVRQAW